MKVLITNCILSGRGGTETFTRDLALQLQILGHTPIVYTPELGAIGYEIQERGIPVTDDINTIRDHVDIIHGHHTVPTAIAIAKFPKTPAIFVCHDFVAWHDSPPQLPNVLRFVAIGPTSANRLTFRESVAREKVVIIANGVERERFRPGPPLPPKLRRALAFCRSAELAHVIREACAQRALPVDLIGSGVGNLVDQPETLMPQYDLVFASGRTAQEALSCGRAVICCDNRGLAGFMTNASFDSWQRNLGLISLQKELTIENMLAEIDKYDVAEADDFLKSRHHPTMRDCAATYVELYESVIAEWSSRPADDEAIFASIAAHMQLYSPHTSPFWPWVNERQTILEELTRRRRNIVPTGATLFFGRDGTAWDFVTAENFHQPEDGCAWSNANAAYFDLYLPPGIACHIIFEFSAIIAKGKRGNRVTFKSNGSDECEMRIERNGGVDAGMGKRETIELVTKVPDSGEVRIVCEVEDIATPPGDLRRLGII
jgi:hypothetical protein